MTPAEMRQLAAECRARAQMADSADARRWDIDRAAQLERRAAAAESPAEQIPSDPPAPASVFNDACQRAEASVAATRPQRIRTALRQMEVLLGMTTPSKRNPDDHP